MSTATSKQTAEVIAAFQMLDELLRRARHIQPAHEGIIQLEVVDDRRLDVQIALSPREPARVRVGSHPFPRFAVSATSSAFVRFLTQGGSSTDVTTQGDFTLWEELLRIVRAPAEERKAKMKGRPWLAR